MSQKRLNLKKYGITAHRERELINFCRQYPDWVEQLENGPRRRSDYCLPSFLRSKNRISDPTAREAIIREALLKKCRLVEQAAIAINSELYEKIIFKSCYGLAFAEINPGCRREEFEKMEDAFFCALDELKE